MDGKRVVTWASFLVAVLVWIVLAQYLINDVLTLAVAVAVGLAGPIVYQAYETFTRPGSGRSRSQL